MSPIPAILCAIALLSAPVSAGDVTLQLRNGDRLTGTLVANTGDVVVLAHDVLGMVYVPVGELGSLADPAPLPSALLSAEQPIETPTPLLVDAAQPAQPIQTPTDEPGGWSGTLDVGLTGASGNSDQSSLRTGLSASKDEGGRVIDTEVSYRRSEQDGETSEDVLLLEGRVTWPEQGSPWSTFVQGSYERDRFTDYDSRIALGAGRAHTFRDDDQAWGQTRFGLGVSRESGGSGDDLKPEGILGWEWRRYLGEGEQFTAKVELNPAIDELGEFRSLARAAWETSLDAATPWLLKVGAQHKYDSESGSADPSDWSYFLSLGYRF